MALAVVTGRGAVVQPEQRNDLIEYLSVRFSSPDRYSR
jgi:hypothetical protein